MQGRTIELGGGVAGYLIGRLVDAA